jgi:hypothetical protein
MAEFDPTITPPGYTDAEWRAVLAFLDRHTDSDGNCDIDAMNAEARANWLRLHPEDRPACHQSPD